MRHTAIFTLILCTAAAVAVSCSDDIDSPDAVGNSIFIPNTADETNYAEMEFDGEWNLENPTSWLTVSPKSGSAGKTRLRLTALDTNPEMIERVGNFTVNIGGKLTKYYVIQDAVPGTVQDPSKLSILIFTAKDGSFTGSAGNLIEYRDYGFIIDNAAVLYPDGNLLEFAYNN